MHLILSFFLALIPAGEQGRIPGLPSHLEDQFARGIEAQKTGDLDGAEGLFKTLLDQGGNLSPVHNALGNVYQLKGLHEKALVEFGASGRLDPADPVHHSLAGASLMALGRSREAVRELRQAVKMQPESLVFREQLAGAYLRLENYPAVIEQYSKLLELNAENSEYRYYLGRAYLAYSVSCFERIKDINAGSARLFQETGNQYLVQGKLDKAIESYEKARGADPSIPEIHFLLAQFYLKQGDRAKALQSLNQALTLMPDSPRVLALKEALLSDSEKP
jgi:tetratricopeptide (TPR) repeat protein